MTPRDLITRITGQDGSNLAELLLDKGFVVEHDLRAAGVGRPLAATSLRA